MEKYSLYLDEIQPGGHFDHFSLAGIAIKNRDYEHKIIPVVNKIKSDFFNGDTTIILHEKEIQSKKSGTPFEIFQQPEIRQKFWDEAKGVFSNHELFVFAVCIHEKESQHLYETHRDKYFISLQVILENYVHFLDKVNGKGDIFIESSDPNPYQKDEQLQYHYHHLKAHGTLFYDRRTIQRHLGTISFPLKADNIIGLQLADLIPNSLVRQLCSNPKKQRTYGLIDVIMSKAYDGFKDRSNRFGIKIIP